MRITNNTITEFSALLFRKMSEKYGGETTLNELRVMNQVWRCHLRCSKCDCGPTALSEMTGIPKSTVSRTVFNLIQAGWLVEERHPNDRRRNIVRPGPRSTARIEADWRECIEWLEELTA